MTMPSEEVMSLKCAHEFIRSILAMKPSDFRKMDKQAFKAWREEAYYAIKHYPFDCHIDELYKNHVCMNCGSDVEFCKCKQKA